MIPLVDDHEKMFLMVRKAIKAVYASSFYKDSKAYMQATANVIDEEKMAIVIQTVSGTRYGDRFYPTLSGVARSIDYYPIPPGKSEDGTASIALGLGKYVVDGGLAIRFSPKYPKNILQLSTPEMALKETQKYFYALDQSKDAFDPTPDDSNCLLKLNIREAEKDGSIKSIASTYDLHNNVMNDGYNYDGKKLITFSNILKHDTFPIAKIIEEVLKLGEKEMGNPVEIEFVMDLYPNKEGRYTFNLLQIRPIASRHDTVFIERDNIDESKTIIISDSALGNGIIDNIRDVVYVRPQNFDASKNEKTTEMIDEVNKMVFE